MTEERPKSQKFLKMFWAIHNPQKVVEKIMQNV